MSKMAELSALRDQGLMNDSDYEKLCDIQREDRGDRVRYDKLMEDTHYCKHCGSELDGGYLKNPNILAHEIECGVCNSCQGDLIADGDVR
jgi:hypothetical protein